MQEKHYEDERLATEEEDVRYNTRMLELAGPIVTEQEAQTALLESEERSL